MKRRSTVLASAMLFVLLSASLSAHTQTPILAPSEHITNYHTAFYINNVTQITGNQCTFTAQQLLIGQLEFTAGSGASPTFINTSSRDSQGLPLTIFFHLPPIPTGGNTSWTGTATRQSLPGGTLVGPFPFSGTFQATSRLTFIGTMTFTNLPFGNGSASCTVNLQFSSAFTGASPRF